MFDAPSLWQFLCVCTIILVASTGCSSKATPSRLPTQEETVPTPTPSSVPPEKITDGSSNEEGLTLIYIDRFDIKDKSEGLSEPSGLVLSNLNDALWTVSDNENKIFHLTLQGELQKKRSFRTAEKGLEGITLDPTGEHLFMVQEDDNEILKVQLTSQDLVDRRRLFEMSGYEAVAAAFAQGGKNKGLEGITWNTSTDRLFVLKEGEPGLLVEVASDLNSIYLHRTLNHQNGFRDDDVVDADLDYSGLSYDVKRNAFWIVSDKGRRIFLYDWTSDRVLYSAALDYSQDGVRSEIEKAEGVVLDVERDRLYVVSDAEARLYVYDVEG